MTYEFIQAALTNLITFSAIAGFGGIYLHHVYSEHQRWMAKHCPPVKPYSEAVKERSLPPSPEPEPLSCDITPGTHWDIAASDGSAWEICSPLTCEWVAPTPAKRRPGRPKKQPTTLAEDLGLIPPAGWGKATVNHKATRGRKRKSA